VHGAQAPRSPCPPAAEVAGNWGPGMARYRWAWGSLRVKRRPWKTRMFSYLEWVRSFGSKIGNTWKRRGLGHYCKTVGSKGLDLSRVYEQCLVTLQVDKAWLAANDIRVKYEMQQPVSWDILGLCEVRTEAKVCYNSRMEGNAPKLSTSAGIQAQDDEAGSEELDKYRLRAPQGHLAEHWARSGCSLPQGTAMPGPSWRSCWNLERPEGLLGEQSAGRGLQCIRVLLHLVLELAQAQAVPGLRVRDTAEQQGQVGGCTWHLPADGVDFIFHDALGSNSMQTIQRPLPAGRMAKWCLRPTAPKL
ncbi:LOW QUALITY PROTEIN: hypothetical protein J0S82_012475, partial [Galemys pyrenaicus]